MIYNFTEMKKRNESMEEELQALKKNYQKPQISNNQLDKLRKRMEEANMENRRDKRKKRTDSTLFGTVRSLLICLLSTRLWLVLFFSGFNIKYKIIDFLFAPSGCPQAKQ